MEFQNLELTVQDILNLHQAWISELYVQDKKTEEEIVNLCCERRLFVTTAQIQRCVREWGLVQLPAVEDSVPSPSPTLSDDWEFISSPGKSEAPPEASQVSHIASDPTQISEYKDKPLPSLPPKVPQNAASKIQKKRPTSTTDLLKLTCHHGPSSADVHEVQKALDTIPDGTSMMDRYAGDEQTHELLALGLEYRRARDADSNSDLPRRKVAIRVKKRTKRKLEQNEDGPERKERKKTPPSPCASA